MQPVTTVEDVAFIANLLGEVDTNLPSRLPLPLSLKAVRNALHRKVRVLSPPLLENRPLPSTKPTKYEQTTHLLHTPPREPTYDEDLSFGGGLEDDDFPSNEEMPSSPITKAVERKKTPHIKAEDEEDKDMMEVVKAVGDHNVKSASINISGAPPAAKTIKQPPYPSPESSSPTRPPADSVDPSAWNKVTSKLNVLNSYAPETIAYGKLKLQDALEEDGNVRMFWTDYTEINGSLCFFGKVKDKNTGIHVSAFVKVENILRKLYFLPRAYRQRM